MIETGHEEDRHFTRTDGDTTSDQSGSESEKRRTTPRESREETKE